MHITVDFSEQTLRLYDNSDSPVLFKIYWEQDGLCYPDQNWLDFGAVLLGWWFSAIEQLRLGCHECKFSFMEGPYSISAAYNPNSGMVELTPKELHVKWRIPLDQLAIELMKAAEETYRVLVLHNVAEQERVSLEKGVKFLMSDFNLET